MMVDTTHRTSARPISSEDVRHQCGDILDWQVEAIVETGATPGQLEEARAWAAGQDDQMGDERRPLTGVVAQLYDILTAEDAFDDEEVLPPS